MLSLDVFARSSLLLLLFLSSWILWNSQRISYASSPQVQILVDAIALFEMWRNLLFAICSAQHVSCLYLRSSAFAAFSKLEVQLTSAILSDLKENPFFSKYVLKGSRKKKTYFTVRIKIEKSQWANCAT